MRYIQEAKGERSRKTQNNDMDIDYPYQPEWTNVEGVLVLRIEDDNMVAVPVTGKKNSSSFEIIDLNDRSDSVCRVSKDKVRWWLMSRYFAVNDIRHEPRYVRKPEEPFRGKVPNVPWN